MLLFIVLKRTALASIQQTTSTLKYLKACQISNTVSRTAKNVVPKENFRHWKTNWQEFEACSPGWLVGEWNGNRSGWVRPWWPLSFNRPWLRTKRGNGDIRYKENWLRFLQRFLWRKIFQGIVTAWLSGMCSFLGNIGSSLFKNRPIFWLFFPNISQWLQNL